MGDEVSGRTPLPETDRFWSKVNKTDECWLWTGNTNGKYGCFRVGSRSDGSRRTMLAHVWAWGQVNGPVPTGLVFDHVKDRGCLSKLCVRVEHLEVTTQQENILRGSGLAAQNAAKVACPTCGGAYRQRNNRTGRWCPACDYRRRKTKP